MTVSLVVLNRARDWTTWWIPVTCQAEGVFERICRVTDNDLSLVKAGFQWTTQGFRRHTISVSPLILKLELGSKSKHSLTHTVMCSHQQHLVSFIQTKPIKYFWADADGKALESAMPYSLNIFIDALIARHFVEAVSSRAETISHSSKN